MHRTTIDHPFAEKKTAEITAVIRDEKGAPLPAASLTALTLTLYNRKDGAVINGRSQSDILNTGGGSVDASGNLALTLAPLDMAIVDANEPLEQHVALIEWSYGAGKAGGHEIYFHVENLTKIS